MNSYISNIKYSFIQKLEQRKYANLLSKSLDNMLLQKIQGSLMLLDLSDLGISKELSLNGVHESNSTHFVMKELKKGMTMVEIGANIGYYSLIESRIVGPSGKVIAFEPNPKNMKHLKINVLLNGFEDRFQFYPYAVGSKNTYLDFFLADRGNLSSFIKRNDNLCKYTKQRTKVVKLDDFLKEKIDYLRMDVEGYETEVIKGMNKILSGKQAPYGLYIEVHSKLLQQQKMSGRKFIKIMNDYGYEIKKSFYRGRSDISVTSYKEFMNHNLADEGYWETFFYRNKR